MQLELCDEDVQDQVTSRRMFINGKSRGESFHKVCLPQVVTSIGELVEMCSPQILSGWRPLFSALRTVHSGKSDLKDYLLGEYSMGTTDAPVARNNPESSRFLLFVLVSSSRKVSGSGL